MRRDLTGLRAGRRDDQYGVHFADHVVAAVGIESNGHKHVLGLQEEGDREYRILQGAG